MRELDMEADAARKVFLVLDTARTGWIAVTELDFLYTFEGPPPAHSSPGTPGSTEGQLARAHLTASSSAPTLLLPPGMSTASSWGSVRHTLWSPAKSSRAMQHRCLAQS